MRPLQSKTNTQYVNRAITDYCLLQKGSAKNQQSNELYEHLCFPQETKE